jgi:hypothetical protein
MDGQGRAYDKCTSLLSGWRSVKHEDGNLNGIARWRT